MEMGRFNKFMDSHSLFLETVCVRLDRAKKYLSQIQTKLSFENQESESLIFLVNQCHAPIAFIIHPGTFPPSKSDDNPK